MNAAFKAALAARQTDENSIILCTITHDDFATIRLARERTDIVSGGDTYTAWDFDISLPQERPDKTVSMQISFDNSNHLLTNAVRTTTGYPKVTIEVVSGADPDTIQVTTPAFYLINAQYVANRVIGRLSMKPMTGEPFPGDFVTPRKFGGTF